MTPTPFPDEVPSLHEQIEMTNEIARQHRPYVAISAPPTDQLRDGLRLAAKLHEAKLHALTLQRPLFSPASPHASEAEAQIMQSSDGRATMRRG